MNGRHLPAGQVMPSDMSRRRPYNQSQHHHNNHNQQPYPPGPGPQMYNPYANPYNANFYPQHQQMPPQYHNTGMPHQQYGPYPPYIQSPPPPPMQHFPRPPIPQQQSYPPRPQQSPVVASSYQAPPPPQTPSSTQSTHTVPRPMTPPTPQPALSAAPISPPQAPPAPPPRQPFRAPLPWFSRPDLPWPTKRSRRRRKPTSEIPAESVKPPQNQLGKTLNTEETSSAETSDAAIPRPETPSTNHPQSEGTSSTTPTTPSSIQQTSATADGDITPLAAKPTRKLTVPAVPIISALPKSAPRDTSKQATHKVAEEVQSEHPAVDITQEDTQAGNNQGPTEETVVESQAWKTPKLWTGLFNPNASANAYPTSGSGAEAVSGNSKSNAESLVEALRSFSAVSNDAKVSFLEPRGLVNTGNMCYMNSVLQVLVFCDPFFTFLNQVGKQTTYSFKSETPLIDAMIMFMREFPIIDSATSVEQLKLRLKEGELEQYGEPFTPDFVYDVIKRLPRFSSMRRGHQQDAEEFLGFLLEGLHDECVQVMRASTSNATSAIATPTNGPSSPTSDTASIPGSGSAKENGWLEVGPKQKAAITRSSGTIVTGSPITKIFGGNLRSELRVPGLKDSVTLEPYQPLQLDIGAPNVNNIIDALKGLTRSEALHGDFKSPKGPNVTATKQVFIETLPPVLILHLKRFQYDNAGGTQKIWKKVGYPLELEIPKEVFPRQKRGVYAHGGLPKYRLIAVVYHHGKNASGGHYTVDVRRQDGREWIRLDDTVIRRVRSEDVAEGGSEEDPKVLAAALEAHKKDTPSSGNMFSSINDEEESTPNDGWKQASGPGKKWSNVVNGTSTSTPKAKSEKFSVKDNKVAYLLFYQKI
ncbi:putative ubiquitin carboxyl-terminal hydrolase [Lachnellula subtilissima]|uniref:Ubiquitin carboxyl-terminal hydrolase n=1 Tax=Lachnellula subtilissima TaxID=602034 RepID=A0A8H8RU70_9HELO|nr:putative ubiquitin carboxyl-terminal hydrolase [Lachnellula subtilissima]